MKYLIKSILLIGFCACSYFTIAQNITQTVRGIILDEEGQFPLTGVTIALSKYGQR